jgi:hypothetical protein
MPRQNRVTPFGEIIATPERGTFFGNRGVLHDEHGRIRRIWQVKRWIVCVLQFRGRHRQIMTPGRYTELFFLDEATALAAGHRPCAECRHSRYADFCAAWQRGLKLLRRPTAGEMDDRLHAERLTADRTKRIYRAELSDLADGVFVLGGSTDDEPCLLWHGRLFTWSAGGYVRSISRPKRGEVRVLTPPSIVAAIRGGYVPEVHASTNR